jgi:hypothetical protein
VYSDQYSFIFKESAEVVFLDHKKNQQINISNQHGEWHDVQFHKNIWIFLNEKHLRVTNGKQENIIYPENEYIFLKAQFLYDNRFVILSSNPTDSKDCLIQVYELVNNEM